MGEQRVVVDNEVRWLDAIRSDHASATSDRREGAPRAHAPAAKALLEERLDAWQQGRAAHHQDFIDARFGDSVCASRGENLIACALEHRTKAALPTRHLNPRACVQGRWPQRFDRSSLAADHRERADREVAREPDRLIEHLHCRGHRLRREERLGLAWLAAEARQVEQLGLARLLVPAGEQCVGGAEVERPRPRLIPRCIAERSASGNVGLLGLPQPAGEKSIGHRSRERVDVEGALLLQLRVVRRHESAQE